MKIIISFLVLIILPTLLYLTGFIIKDAGGPYYLNYYDPSYVYLINSLNVMQLSSVGHFDHPGTSVQTIGAIILKLKFISAYSNDEVIREVFSNPETYLELINRSFVFINSIALFLLGIYIFRITKNIYLSLLIQLSPFITFQIIYGLVIVAPENILIFTMILFIGMLFHFIYNSDSDSNSLIFIILFGVLCGFGIVTKLTFIPFLIIPLIIIKKIKNKVLFSVIAFLSFIFFFTPAISNFENFIFWIQKLIFTSKIHGTFDSKPFDSFVFFTNIKYIFSQDKIFFITYILMLISLIAGYMKHYNETVNLQFYKQRKVLLAIFIGITFQIIIITKNYVPYTQYYLIPSFMLSITGLYLSVTILFEIFKKFLMNIKLNQIYLSFSVLILIFALLLFIKTYKEVTIFRDEAYKTRNIIINNYRNELVIPAFMTANDNCALAYTVFNNFAGSNTTKYKMLFNEMLSSKIFYNAYKNNFFTLSDNIDIEKQIREKKKVIVQLTSLFTSIENFTNNLKENYNLETVRYKEVITNLNGESVYEIEIK